MSSTYQLRRYHGSGCANNGSYLAGLYGQPVAAGLAHRDGRFLAAIVGHRDHIIGGKGAGSRRRQPWKIGAMMCVQKKD